MDTHTSSLQHNLIFDLELVNLVRLAMQRLPWGYVENISSECLLEHIQAVRVDNEMVFRIGICCLLSHCSMIQVRKYNKPPRRQETLELCSSRELEQAYSSCFVRIFTVLVLIDSLILCCPSNFGAGLIKYLLLQNPVFKNSLI